MIRSDGTSEWWSAEAAYPWRAREILRFVPPVTLEQAREALDAKGWSQTWHLTPLDDGREEPGVAYGVSAR